MAVEEEGVEATGGRHAFAEIEQGRCRWVPFFCVFGALGWEREWGGVVVEGGFGVAEETPEVHFLDN